jgi:hypothetical protein
MFVFLNSLVIILVSFSIYVRVAHFYFLVVCFILCGFVFLDVLCRIVFIM